MIQVNFITKQFVEIELDQIPYFSNIVLGHNVKMPDVKTQLSILGFFELDKKQVVDITLSPFSIKLPQETIELLVTNLNCMYDFISSAFDEFSQCHTVPNGGMSKVAIHHFTNWFWKNYTKPFSSEIEAYVFNDELLISFTLENEETVYHDKISLMANN